MSTQDPTTTGMNPDDLASLREAAEAGRKAQRELAFMKAGIATETPLGTFFTENYKGELDPAAIKASWDALGVPTAPAETPAVQAPATPPPAQVPAAVQPGQQPAQFAGVPVAADGSTQLVDPRVLLGQGATADPNATGLEAMHPGERGIRAYREALNDPRAQTSAADEYFGHVFAAAQSGDPRVLGGAEANRYQPS